MIYTKNEAASKDLRDSLDRKTVSFLSENWLSSFTCKLFPSFKFCSIRYVLIGNMFNRYLERRQISSSTENFFMYKIVSKSDLNHSLLYFHTQPLPPPPTPYSYRMLCISAFKLFVLHGPMDTQKTHGPILCSTGDLNMGNACNGRSEHFFLPKFPTSTLDAYGII